MEEPTLNLAFRATKVEITFKDEGKTSVSIADIVSIREVGRYTIFSRGVGQSFWMYNTDEIRSIKT